MLDASWNRVPEPASHAAGAQPARLSDLAARLADVRAATERLCEPLAAEDYVVQSMPDPPHARWQMTGIRLAR